MAKLYPSDMTAQMLQSAHSGELATLKLLHSELPDYLHVFHSTHWSLEGQRHTQFGEIDFLVVDANGKVILIEQKNGALEESNGELIKRYGAHRKNVAEQIHRMRDGVLDKFRDQNNGARLSLDYLFYCPDHKLIDTNCVALGKERIVDTDRKSQLPAILQGLLSNSNDLTLQCKRVLDFFCNEYRLMPDISTYKSQ